ncbi:unnamed protein product, partial [Phaeothamnion confervicola]
TRTRLSARNRRGRAASHSISSTDLLPPPPPPLLTATASVGVLQSLADHDPDVDAIYRLAPLPLPLSFPTAGPLGLRRLAVLQPGTFAPFNAQATVFFPSCFWGLLLPVTVHGRVSDIWRSYLMQALMPAVGATLAFSDAWVVQHRNPHNYLADFQSELPLYLKSAALVDHLRRGMGADGGGDDGAPAAALAARVEALFVDMFEREIVEEDDVLLAQAWLWDLAAVGYGMPTPR